MAENFLDQSLERAAANPALKPALGKALLASTIYVIGHVEGEDPAKQSQSTIKDGTKLVLRSHTGPDGRVFVPFFSSLEKLQGFIEGQASYIGIPAAMLFDMAKGATLVLNPGSRVS